MMKQKLGFLLQGWHAARWIRLGVGIIFAVWAIFEKDWMLGLLSGIFLLQAFSNSGCCSNGSCGDDGCSF